ncbi:MAG: C1 family peptidase [Bacteroidota bacterium]
MRKHNFFVRTLPMLIFLLSATVSVAQFENIKIIKEVKCGPVENQKMSSTCWSFATCSFITSELIRMGKPAVNLSEMYFVRKAYEQKAVYYRRLQGNANFGPGGQAHDVMNMMRDYGAVPESVYTGLDSSGQMIDHEVMDALLLDIVKLAVKDNLSEKSINAFIAVLDSYLGKVPENFTYEGKSYTPKTFAESLTLNPDDYIEFTSYTHHPFYKSFRLEVPDNWAFGDYYNLPIDELMQIIDNALDNGYSVDWDGDVSDDQKFSANGGVAKLSDESIPVTQKKRQEGFDDYDVTDDHLMHITGYGKDASDKKFYLTKNSWGTAKGHEGFWFMSDAFVRYKTIAIMVHKDAVPAAIKAKLGIK